METQLTDDRRTDSLDHEAFDDMVQSAAFHRFLERIVTALGAAQGQCERAEDEVTLRRAQGQVAALRMTIALPQQMLNEMKARNRNALPK